METKDAQESLRVSETSEVEDTFGIEDAFGAIYKVEKYMRLLCPVGTRNDSLRVALFRLQ